MIVGTGYKMRVVVKKEKIASSGAAGSEMVPCLAYIVRATRLNPESFV